MQINMKTNYKLFMGRGGGVLAGWADFYAKPI